ncbi:MAG: class I SAM-dependent methyltransferase [Pseudomonadota bacterium]
MPRDDRPKIAAQTGWKAHRSDLRNKSLRERFTAIHDLNIWGARQSRSGLGSEPAATAAISDQIISLVDELNVQSVLDAPCGEGFLSEVLPQNFIYHGMDIVPILIKTLSERFSTSPNRHFSVSDICSNPLPEFDLVVCRDLLVHLSYNNIKLALQNIISSGSRYVLLTHFTDFYHNKDIEDGDWRALSMTQPPFNFPEPLKLLDERCLEADGAYADKVLALWQVEPLKKHLDEWAA